MMDDGNEGRGDGRDIALTKDKLMEIIKIMSSGVKKKSLRKNTQQIFSYKMTKYLKLPLKLNHLTCIRNNLDLLGAKLRSHPIFI